MCGIVGIINLRKSESELLNSVVTMATCIRHRGPDNHGNFVDAEYGVGLGHQRLSIHDLSALGNQPMVSESGRFTIVFNGEIYNFREIKKDLSKEGIGFRGHSDTEVLLAAIERWGLKQAVTMCEGMFAFALWDKQENTLNLCRDRLGEKPLYIGWHEGTFAFASELRSIHALFPEKRKDVSRKALELYCHYGYVPTPYSINNSVFKVPQGNYITLQPNNTAFQPNTWDDVIRNGVKATCYWSLHKVAEKQRLDLLNDAEAAISELDSVIRSTIRKQLIADVPVGTYLSGGIDSTLVTAIAQQESSTPLKTFTIGFSDKTFDEAPYAQKIADVLGTDHHTKYVETSDVLELVGRLPSLYCEPHANPSVLPAVLVSRIARNEVKVCLSGDGGDELFGGYNRYVHASSILNLIGTIPKPLRSFLYNTSKVIPVGYADSIHRSILQWKGDIKAEQSIGLKIQKLMNMLRLENINEVYEYLVSTGISSDRLFTECGHDFDPYIPSGIDNLNFQEQAMLADQFAYLPDDSLAKVDRASMSCGLETRLPLLSHRLVELSWRVPPHFKINDRTSKWLLRELLARQIDRRLFERPKMGFSVPISSWLRNELRDWMQDLLSTSSLERHGLFNKNYVDELVKEHLSGKRDHANKLWALLTFQAWHER